MAEGFGATYGRVTAIKISYNYNPFGSGNMFSLELNLEEDLATATFWPNDAWKPDIPHDFIRPPATEFHSRLSKPMIVRTEISPNLSRSRSTFRRGHEDVISVLVHAVELSIDAAINPAYKEVGDLLKADGNGSFRLLPEEVPQAWRYAVYTPAPAELDEEAKGLLRIYMDDLSHRLSQYSEDVAPRFALPVGQESYANPIEYIYAHEVAQTPIYSAKDANDYLSRTIHEYASRIGKRKHPLVVEWMERFGIGRDFDIQSIGGEAHLCTITNLDGTQVDLSAKGMGSIQLMVLLLRLALSLPGMTHNPHETDKTFIVEEPEQNLHPSLQSLLADLFHELHRDHGCRFIVETHSEYLIRRSQCIVCDNFADDMQKNPFRVYYFPADGQPYDMEYTPDGTFKKNFGDGFFNEASRQHLQLLKSQRQHSKEGRQDA